MRLSLRSFVAHPIGLLVNAVFTPLPWNPPLTGDHDNAEARQYRGRGFRCAHDQDLGVTALESVEARLSVAFPTVRPISDQTDPV